MDFDYLQLAKDYLAKAPHANNGQMWDPHQSVAYAQAAALIAYVEDLRGNGERCCHTHTEDGTPYIEDLLASPNDDDGRPIPFVMGRGFSGSCAHD